MSTCIYIDGIISGPEDAKVSVFDRGFLYGDSVYEVMRTSAGHLVDSPRHLRRLSSSALSLLLTMPEGKVVSAAISSTMAATGNSECYVRVVVTRGSADVGLDPSLAETPTLIVIAKPLHLPPASLYASGVGVRLVNVQRTSAKAVDPSVKSGNYLNNILALAEARRSQDYEAIMCDRDGFVAEGSSSNVFWVAQGQLVTPSLEVGLLAGITRQRVIELAAKLGIPVSCEKLSPDSLRSASEAFLTSSIRGILPIAQVDGRPLGTLNDGQPIIPAPTTELLMTAYESFLVRYT